MVVRMTQVLYNHAADLRTEDEHSVALTFLFSAWTNEVSVLADMGAFQNRAPGRF